MKSLNALVGPVLTATRARTTKAEAVNTERTAEIAKAFQFESLGDAVLERLLYSTWRFGLGLRSDAGPHWLTLLGRSGIGKTHLARQLYRKAWANWRWYTNERGANLVRPMAWVSWRELSASFKERDFSQLPEIFEAWFCVLDDIGADYDPNGLALSSLDRILSERLGKWTVLTSNLSLKDIGDRLDARIVSRLFRANAKVFEGNTVDYCMRKRVA